MQTKKTSTVPESLLIVGQGLAGSVLALQAAASGLAVTCVDKAEDAIASKAAAGILNPVTGPRLNLSWEVHTLMPAAKAFYTHWEKQLNASFFDERTIRRIFRKESELKYHSKRYKNEATHTFLSDHLQPNPQPHNAFSNLGECHIQAAVLDIPEFLKQVKQWLKAHADYVETDFAHADLDIHADGIQWQAKTFTQVIFCEGAQVKDNPWFGELPFKPAKGESIEIELTHPLPPEILNAQKWIFPFAGNRARTGSTYEWDQLDNVPTEKAKELLLKGVAQMLPDNPVVSTRDHRAGVRPCSHNTRPYVGTHPKHPQLCILNGLGSKGTLMSPWCAQQLLKHLREDTPLHPEMDVQRCF